MPFALLIHEPRGQRESRSEDEGRQLYAAMLAYAASLRDRGLLLGAESLVSDRRSQRLSRAGGSTQILDGPFAESKEMIGGFFLVNCETQAQALELAAECPAAGWASVEVRALGPCFT